MSIEDLFRNLLGDNEEERRQVLINDAVDLDLVAKLRDVVDAHGKAQPDGKLSVGTVAGSLAFLLGSAVAGSCYQRDEKKMCNAMTSFERYAHSVAHHAYTMDSKRNTEPTSH